MFSINLPVNFEKNILDKCGWSEKQCDFYGTLIYNLKTHKQEAIADIICRRDKKGIQIDWILPISTSIPISFSYLREDNCILRAKTDSEIQTPEHATNFLNNLQSILIGQKSDFFPHERFIINKILKL